MTLAGRTLVSDLNSGEADAADGTAVVGHDGSRAIKPRDFVPDKS
jgi:hypothetical protein